MILGVYEDDSQIAEVHLKRSYDNKTPRIEFSIDEVREL